jgi:hypothetical protein
MVGQISARLILTIQVLCRGESAKLREIVARTWNQSVLDILHPNELIGAPISDTHHAAQLWNQAQPEELRLKSTTIILSHVNSG